MVNEAGTGSDATIYDVARVAGVSPSTVSRAFSRPGRVSAQTAERIRQVAEELGYRSREVTQEEIDNKPVWFTLAMAVARLFSPVL